MKTERRSREFLALICITALAGFGLALADDPVFVVEQTTGVLDATEFNKLEIVGIEGTIHVRSGPGDLRFTARSLNNRRDERALALWVDGRTLILTAGQGLENERLLAEVLVPHHLSVTLDASNSRVQATTLPGDFDVTGTKLTLDARGLRGALDAQITDGGIRVDGSTGDVSVTLQGGDSILQRIEGFVSVDQTGGSVDLKEIGGDVSLELSNASVSAGDISGRLDMTATGGKAVLNVIRRGGDWRLEGTTLQMTAINGPVEIETDDAIEFQDVQGGLRIQSYGGGILGADVKGGIQLRGSDFEFRASKIAGPVTIEGDEVVVQLAEVGGDVTVVGRSSQISVEGVDGKLVLSNDFGNIVVSKATKEVEITSTQGTVVVTELSGPIQLKADGPQVSVGWAEAARQQDSVVTNEGGDVVLSFSPRSGGRLDVSSKQGEIHARLPGIDVTDDLRSASGFVNRLTRPKIEVVAGGNVTMSASATPPPNSATPTTEEPPVDDPNNAPDR